MAFSVHVNLLFIIIPKSFTLVARSKSIPWMVTGGIQIGCFWKEDYKSSVLSIKGIILFALDQNKVCSSSVCIRFTFPFWTRVLRVVSSMYLCTAHGGCRPLISIMKTRGPSHDPWGTDPFRPTEPDNSWQSLFIGKECTQP